MSQSTGAGMQLRDYRIHRYVNAFCPRCHEEQPDRELSDVRRLSGWLAVRDGRVWLERGCPDHGMISTLYDESAEILTYLEQWTAPTKVHGPDTLGNFKPVPSAYEDGLPQMQTQHTCILLEDLTDHCNLRCPTCFAESSPAAAAIAPARRGARLGRRPARAGERPHRRAHAERRRADALPVARAAARPPGRAPDRAHPAQLERSAHRAGRRARRDAASRHRERVEVYLQYDGESAEASAYHRGADIRRFKERALERLSAAGVFTTLTMTAALGVNDGEIGAVIRRAMATPYVGGVTIQPVFGSGRSAGIDPNDRLTHTGVLARLGAADRRRGHLARSHGAPVQPSALLLGRLPAARRLRRVEVAHRAHRARPAEGVPRPRARSARQPHRRQLDQPGAQGCRQRVAPRPAQRAVVAVAPLDDDRSGATSARTAISASARSRRWRPRRCPASTSGCAR